MRVREVADAGTARQLRWEWLLAEIEPVSDYGRQYLTARKPFAPGQGEAAHKSARRFCKVASLLGEERIDAMRAMLRNLPDVTPVLARAAMRDGLSDLQLFELLRFCDAVLDLAKSSDSAFQIPTEAAGCIAELLRSGHTEKHSFFLDDAFSDRLVHARAELRAAQETFDVAHGRLAGRLAQALGRAEITGPEFIVMRTEVSGALPPGLRAVREAPTYFLCELELDEPALRALARRDEAFAALAQAEHEVRASLSSRIAEYVAKLEHSIQLVGEIDGTLAVARFTLRHECVVPEYVSGAELAATGARFVPLQVELQQHNRTYTAIDFQLSGTTVITGPNMGGKSAALQTAGFIALCAAMGIPVPATSARVCLFTQIVWLGSGAPDDSGGLLSSYASEVVRLQQSLGELALPALFLIDEPARTTTPIEGSALLVALIDHLNARGVCAFVATHLSGVTQKVLAKHYAVRGLRRHAQVSAASDLEAALRAVGDAMDYTIEEVGTDAPPRSDALYLAQALGLESTLIERARSILGGEVAPHAKRS